jgi:hypothetical protein
MTLRRRARSIRPNVSIGLGGLGSLLWPVLLLGGLGFGVYYGVSEMQKFSQKDVEQSAAKARTVKKPTYRKDATSPAASPDQAEREGLEQAAVDANIAVLRKELARLEGNTASVTRALAGAREARDRYDQLAGGRPAALEALDPYDELLGMDSVDLSSMGADAGASWLRERIAFIAPGTTLRVRVKRGGGEAGAYLVFPRGVGASSSASDPSARVKISESQALEIQRQILSLPPSELSPSERKDIERIVGQGEASAEEFAAIRRRLTSTAVVAADLSKERAEFTAALRKLQPMLSSAPVPEAVILKDGRKFVGSLAGETNASLSIGTLVGAITLPKDEVKERITAQELREEFQRRYATGGQFREAYLQLLTWTRDWGMPVHREYVALTLLVEDPNDRVARMAAGYFQGSGGAWIPSGSVAAGAPVGQRSIRTKAEAKPELESMGFILKNNRWFARAAWEDGFDSLHQPGKAKISMSGTVVMPWHEQDTPKYRLDNPSGKPRDGSAPRLRFFAPTAVQGIVNIALEAPGEIVEVQVKALGGVLDEGPMGKARVETWVTPQGGRSHVLYDLTSGKDDAWHDVSAVLRGAKKFTLSSRLSTVKDSYHAYARFLPSVPESKGVFGVKGVVLRPDPEIDRIWATLQ